MCGHSIREPNFDLENAESIPGVECNEVYIFIFSSNLEYNQTIRLLAMNMSVVITTCVIRSSNVNVNWKRAREINEKEKFNFGYFLIHFEIKIEFGMLRYWIGSHLDMMALRNRSVKPSCVRAFI